MPTPSEIYALEQPAILAYRPYPPLKMRATLSQLGGLPLLASRDDWPRADDGTPLHFLTRIDCRDLPPERGDLPRVGVLQFFAVIDEEMRWAGDEEPSNDYRVLYALEPGKPTEPPEDLPPIMAGGNDWDRDFRLPEEPLTSVYQQWPLAFGAIRTWPSETIWESGKAERAYIDSLKRASGFAPFEHTRQPWETGDETLPLPPHAPGEAAFPQVWIFCERIARWIARVAADQRDPAASGAHYYRDAETDPTKIAELIRIEQNARQWIARARAVGLDQPVEAGEAQGFVAWLRNLAGSQIHRIAAAFRGGYDNAMESGVRSAIRYSGAHPAAARLIPRALFDVLRRDHTHVELEAHDGELRVESVAHHQLLGRHQASQLVEAGDNEVLLLQLVSDYGVDFMFCDVGEIHFWIDKADLAARRFDRVRANTQGG